MKKNDLMNEIASISGCSRTDTGRVFDAIIAITIKHLRHDGQSVIPGLGHFKIQSRQERQGRNPKTGEAVTIKARKAVKFKSSPSLNGAIQ